MSALLVAASMGRYQNISILIDAGAVIDEADNNGLTALMWASLGGDDELIRSLETEAPWFAGDGQRDYKKAIAVLLDSGADITLRDNEENDAVFYAPKSGHDDIVAFLRQYRVAE